MAIKVEIPKEKGEGVTAILNGLLSDEYVLYTRTRNYHWNVVGLQFNDLHKFFEKQYAELNDVVDEVAERARSLGERSRATIAEFGKSTRLKEHPGEYPDAKGMVTNLLADHEALVRTLRTDLAACAEKLGDMGTSDFLTGLMERHEKMAWMLRAMVEG